MYEICSQGFNRVDACMRVCRYVPSLELLDDLSLLEGGELVVVAV